MVPGNDISTTVGQSGEFLKLVRWTQRAWEEIQVEQPWCFRWVPFSQALTASTRVFDLFGASYLNVTGAKLQTDPLVLEHPTTGQKKRMDFLHYRLFLDLFADADTTTVEGWPTSVTQRPDYQIEFDNTLDEAYILTGAYISAPQELTADSDVPDMPEQYHQAILYRALKKYAEFEEAGPLYNTASYNDSMWSDRMQRDLLPVIQLGHAPLA